MLTGQQHLEFVGAPPQHLLSLPLTRAVVSGSIDAPTTMSFWIEYGVTNLAAPAWLKFYDRGTAAPSATLLWDAPMHGETSILPLYVDLTDAAYDALPPGDYVAVVKGVRRGFGQGRAVDFVQPVAFTKGESVGSSTKPLKPLYVNERQSFEFAARAGDRFLVGAAIACLGSQIPGGDTGANADSLRFVVDNEADYGHASDVMNLYNPLAISTGPIQIVAKKNLVRIALLRYSQGTCDGTLGGNIWVRRLAFDAVGAPPVFTDAGNQLTFTQPLTLTDLGDQLNADQSRQTVWNFKAQKPTLVLQQTVSAATSFTVPPNVAEIRVIPQSAAAFQGVLAALSPGGDKGTVTTSDDANSGGFGSSRAVLNGAFQGLTLAKPSAGQTLLYQPLTAGSATIEMRLDAPDTWTAAATAPTDLATWVRHTTQTLVFTVVAADTLPTALAAFTPDHWSYELRVPYEIDETVTNTNPDAMSPPLVLWTSEARFSLPLR